MNIIFTQIRIINLSIILRLDVGIVFFKLQYYFNKVNWESLRNDIFVHQQHKLVYNHLKLALAKTSK